MKTDRYIGIERWETPEAAEAALQAFYHRRRCREHGSTPEEAASSGSDDGDAESQMRCVITPPVFRFYFACLVSQADFSPYIGFLLVFALPCPSNQFPLRFGGSATGRETPGAFAAAHPGRAAGVVAFATRSDQVCGPVAGPAAQSDSAVSSKCSLTCGSSAAAVRRSGRERHARGAAAARGVAPFSPAAPPRSPLALVAVTTAITVAGAGSCRQSRGFDLWLVQYLGARGRAGLNRCSTSRRDGGPVCGSVLTRPRAPPSSSRSHTQLASVVV